MYFFIFLPNQVVRDVADEEGVERLRWLQQLPHPYLSKNREKKFYEQKI